jgi:preprotein translocase subunit SecD
MKTAQKVKISIIILVLGFSAYVLKTRPINLGLDLQGGTRLILEAKDTEKVKADNDAVLGALAVIRNRVDGLGISEPVISRKGIKQIIVELPGVKDPERAVNLIGETALLEFVEGEWAPGDVSRLTPEKLEILAGKNARVGAVIDYDAQGRIKSERPIILKETVLTGADLKNAEPGTNQYGEPIVQIEFTVEGTKKFRDVTTRSVGKPLAIILDKKVISAPNINEPINGGKAQISGHFTVTEMSDLVIKLKAGALPVPVEVISNKTVGPTLGRDSIEKSKKAGIAGFAIVCIFMILFYQIPGFMAAIALILYALLSVTCLKLLNATLTLPGIAGFILTMGMAVDANVIIFERIKEEKRNGQAIKGAIAYGFTRAFRTIVDANITTLIAAVVLFWLGTGPIKGFSVTLSIGILVSMFTALVITRLLLEGLASISQPKTSIFFKTEKQ